MTMLNGFFNVGPIDGVYWTLFVELRFYILVGLLIVAGQMRFVERYIFLWFLISVSNYFLKLGVLDYLFFTSYAPYFIAGSIFYLIKTSGFSFARGAMLAGSFILSFFYHLETLSEKQAHYGLPFTGAAMFGFLASFYLVFLFVGRTGAPRPRYGKLIAALGGMSYPLYLLHAYNGYVIFNIVPNGWAPIGVVFCTMAVMCLFSFLMWKYIEPQVKNWLRSIFEFLEARRLTHSA